MRTPNKATTVFLRIANPMETCIERTRARVAEIILPDPVPGKVHVPAGGNAAQARKAVGRFVLYEKKGSVGVITAKVNNVGEVYDEIDALLDEIEKDRDIRNVAIFTQNGLFASLPIR